MEEQASKEVLAFLEQLMKLNRALVEIFKTANVELFTDMNKTIKEMYRIQHGSEDPALKKKLLSSKRYFHKGKKGWLSILNRYQIRKGKL